MPLNWLSNRWIRAQRTQIQTDAMKAQTCAQRRLYAADFEQ